MTTKRVTKEEKQQRHEWAMRKIDQGVGFSELAHFIGLDPGIHHRLQEEKEARHLAAESLKMQTEKLAAKNQAAREHRDWAFGRGISPWSGRRLGT